MKNINSHNINFISFWIPILLSDYFLSRDYKIHNNSIYIFKTFLWGKYWMFRLSADREKLLIHVCQLKDNFRTLMKLSCSRTEDHGMIQQTLGFSIRQERWVTTAASNSFLFLPVTVCWWESLNNYNLWD